MTKYLTSKLLPRLLASVYALALISPFPSREMVAAPRDATADTPEVAVQITADIKERLAKLDTVIKESLDAPPQQPPPAEAAKTSPEGDPWSEIHNLQFYMWRSFAFDPQGIRPLHPIDGPSISATEITEDLENRFLLVKDATWPETLGIAPAFNDYIALCQEIIDFRKKRLYSDAKSIAKRGDLDEAYHRLIDAIEQIQSSTSSAPNNLNPAANKPALGEASSLVKNLQSDVDNLAKVTAESSAKHKATEIRSSRFVEENLTPAVEESVWSDFLLQLGHLTGQSGPLAELRVFLQSPWDSTQTLILLVGTLSITLLVLFLVGITRHGTAAPTPHAINKEHASTMTPVEAQTAKEPPAVVPIQAIDPQKPSDNAVQVRVAAVMKALEDEETLSDMVALLSNEFETNATSAQANLQWLATELDNLKSACHMANEQGDLRILSKLLNRMVTAPSFDRNQQGNVDPRQTVSELLMAKVKVALLDILPGDVKKAA